MNTNNRQVAREDSDSRLWGKTEAVMTDLQMAFSTLCTHNAAVDEGIVSSDDSAWVMLSVEHQLKSAIDKLDHLMNDIRSVSAAVVDAAAKL